MLTCDNNHPGPTTTAIVSGKFGNYCNDCISGAMRLHGINAAQWHRDRDYENHKRDLIQPRDHKGNINPDFIREYPEESAEIFTEEEIHNNAG